MTEGEINGRLEPLGYHCRAGIEGGHFVAALHGYAFNKYIESDEKLVEWIDKLEKSDEWELHYDTGAVDIDPNTGTITPHDGNPPYNASIAQAFGGSGHSRPLNAANADFISVKAVARPPYGGNWYKVRPNKRVLPRSN